MKKLNNDNDLFNRFGYNGVELEGAFQQYSLRKVQVLAIHKYISTTERYQQEDLESLQKMIGEFHPIHE